MTAAQFSTASTGQRIRVNAPLAEGQERILTPEALRFVADLEQRFGQRRQQLLGLRADRQRRFNEGELPAFRPETAELRRTAWRVKQTPADLRGRRVEIVGPVDQQSVMSAFQSGASCFVMDFEDSHAPTWNGTLEGQLNLYDAVRGDFDRPDAGNGQDRGSDSSRIALSMRPRGWHLSETHLQVNGNPVSASLFDFGLFMFHNGLQLLEQGATPSFHLPKLESYIEAQLWSDLFAYTEESLGLNHGDICCTVAIETLPAAFEMDEMLYALRDYALGLDFGRRNYIFSFIKRFQADPARVLPEHKQITVDSGFVQACSRLLLETCYQRGAHATCAIAAAMPAEADSDAVKRLEADLAQPLTEGYDAVRVTHPGLVSLANRQLERCPSRADRRPTESAVSEADLLQPAQGTITASGFGDNISLALHYLAGWLGGQGTVMINHCLEDAASAEIARAQIWQWIQHPRGILEDGQEITIELFQQKLSQELERVRQEIGEPALTTDHYSTAAELLGELVDTNHFIEFLTLPAYHKLA
ncbi:malate synthase [Sedimenticola thiotaurini]|uniref:malate synthase n=1 Tax=Sedimenticola thiotaurini TaxID=1543721 RepID=UPI00069A5FA8|nr:malate synthase [Sedimenticola thiotaurini]